MVAQPTNAAVLAGYWVQDRAGELLKVPDQCLDMILRRTGQKSRAVGQGYCLFAMHMSTANVPFRPVL